MSPTAIAWLGAIGGSLIGILGGVLGTYCSVRNTNGPRERTFVVRVAVGFWFGCFAFLAGLWLLPMPQRLLMWVAYGILLPIAILCCNRRQIRIRQEESTSLA